MVEKPHEKDGPSNMAVIGRYILKPYTFDILKNAKPKTGEEIQITDALLQKAKQGNVIAYKFKGKRVGCGSLEGKEKSYLKL
jgi:UTP--glucose-1-phosphate uridylyltransferase